MIPKRIFFYWGNETMSWMRYMTLYSFRKMNPDWEITLFYTKKNSVKHKTWSEFMIQDFHYFNGINYYNEIEKLNITLKEWTLKDNTIISTNLKMGPSHLSNFLKWSKLYEEGGIYSDLDILWFKPIDNFYNTMINGDFNTAICQTEYLSIGLLASAPNNDFFKDIFINGIKKFNNTQYESAGVRSIYSIYKYHVLNEAKERYPHLNFYNIPMNLVYFFRHFDVDRVIENTFHITYFPEESIGYHWYAGHPHIQYYNNILNENNYKEHNITFTELVKHIL